MISILKPGDYVEVLSSLHPSFGIRQVNVTVTTCFPFSYDTFLSPETFSAVFGRAKLTVETANSCKSRFGS